MAELVADCPRCKAAMMTFDPKFSQLVGINYSWERWFEVGAVCRNCSRPSIFLLGQRDPKAADVPGVREGTLAKVEGSLNKWFKVDRHISLRDNAGAAPPEHLPKDIGDIFQEATACAAIQCWNAAGTMFRLCVDLSTKPLLPPEETVGLNSKQRRDLGLRLDWLFAANRLSAELRELSKCIQQDGNDGAHAGTLKNEDVSDLQDFATALLERLYTFPKRLQLAQERRTERRQPRE